MQEIPLHPLVVHLPVGLAMMMPVLAAAVLAGLRKNWFDRRTWVLIVLLQTVLFGGGVAAEQLGHQEEERVEEIVAKKAIKAHEERAETFVRVSGATLAVAGVTTFLPYGAAFTAGAVFTTVASVATAAAAYSAGHSGGELVYVHGAANAYVQTPTPDSAPSAGEDRDSQDDH